MRDRLKRLTERRAPLNERRLTEAEDGPAKLLKGIEEAEGNLHAGLRFASPPRDASIPMQKKFAKIRRTAKKMYEDLEELRLDLDEWIIDHREGTS